MTIAFATVYGTIAVTAAGALLFGTLCRRASRPVTRERLQVARVIRVVRQVA
jgi:hypothetical protein